MARKKKYKEEEVIEKAMYLFWKKGYESTSVRMLEKEMGINQFSVYASFGNKQGVFLESLKCYKKKIQTELLDVLDSAKGIESVKQYFYNFLNFSKDQEGNKGCLVTNTINELEDGVDTLIADEVFKFAANVRENFYNKLRQEERISEKEVEEKANYLIISLQGLSVASKVFKEKELFDYIEGVFKNV
ncbi:TetR/AcrR family transcriptional regulator [Aquimarina aquimarini]|uniref:TetR/AcrR family transcriptional regulator n=1 Tax=Aquimarina aquimarini TaxID=1191734 RepID=UPI000D56260D|nr:TetR/AcrR family transcriptional regulator [Aquimarina aquimarini]